MHASFLIESPDLIVGAQLHLSSLCGKDRAAMHFFFSLEMTYMPCFSLRLKRVSVSSAQQQFAGLFLQIISRSNYPNGQSTDLMRIFGTSSSSASRPFISFLQKCPVAAALLFSLPPYFLHYYYR